MLNAETEAWPDQDVLKRTSELPMPVWFIHGREDPRPSANVAALAHAVNGSQLHIIDGAGHEPWVERTDELREVIALLLASITER